MALFYNKVWRRKPGDPNDPGKWYPVLRSVGTVSEKQVARDIADETTLNPKEAEMAVYQLLKILIRELKNGNTVQLGDWGSFYLTLNTEGVETEEEVSANQVKRVNVRFRAGKELTDAVNSAEFKPAETMVKKKKKKTEE